MRLKRIHLISALVTILLVSLPYVSQGATTQKPGALPQATITFSPSTSPNVNASTWITGSTQQIQWVCNGCPNGVEVTLWIYTRTWSKIATIGRGRATGSIAWTVPVTLSAGNYELRVVSVDDSRAQARKPIAIKLASINIQTPKAGDQLVLGKQYHVTWTYDGNPGPVKLYLVTRVNGTDKSSDDYWVQYLTGGKREPSVLFSSPKMANGQGSAVLTLPDSPLWTAPKANEVVSFRIDIRREMNTNIHSYSYDFGIRCPKNYCVKDGKHWCTDFQNSGADCGACGNDCRDRLGQPSWRYYVDNNSPRGEMLSKAVTCVGGKCQCASHATTCPGTNYCTDLKADKYNCGACGNVCGKDDANARCCSYCNGGTCIFKSLKRTPPHPEPCFD